MAETMVASQHVKSEHSTRKNKKPLMEKRRRARINSCLSQLKSLVLQAIKKDSSQFSKLEKADILELTVKHLRALQRQQATGVMSHGGDPHVVGKYRAGFNECAKEVVRYMGSVREVNEDIKDRVLGHLAGCVQVVNQVTPVESMVVQQQQQQHQMKPLHVHIPQQQQQQQQMQQQQMMVTTTTTAVPQSVLMPTPQSMHLSSSSQQQHPQQTAALSFANAPSPIRSLSVSSSPDSVSSSCSSSSASHLQHPHTPSPVSATPLSALPMMTSSPCTSSASSSAAATHTATMVSPAHTHISGAFKIVPSSSGAVALYLGGGPTAAAATGGLHPLALPHPHSHHHTTTTTANNHHHHHRVLAGADSMSVDAVPLYSVALPSHSLVDGAAAVTAFVPPSHHHHQHQSQTSSPLNSSSSSSSSLQGVALDSRVSANVSPIMADFHHPHHHTSSSSLPVDLRPAHKVKAVVESSFSSSSSSSSTPAVHHHHHHSMSFGQCSPSSMADEKVWRPW